MRCRKLLKRIPKFRMVPEKDVTDEFRHTSDDVFYPIGKLNLLAGVI